MEIYQKMNYSIRISREYSELESWIKGLNNVPYIVVYEHHDGARIHCHMLFKDCPVKTTTLKAQIVKAIGKVAKTDWSFITEYQGNPVDDKVIIYFSKGSLEPVFRKGFTQEAINDCKEQWVVKATNPRGPSPKNHKVTYNKIIEEIIAEYKEYETKDRVVTFDEFGHMHKSPKHLSIPVLVLKYLRRYDIVCGRYKMRDLVDTIHNRIEDTGFEKNFMQMCEFIFRQ